MAACTQAAVRDVEEGISAGGGACAGADTSCVITSAGGDACADTSYVITSAGGDACADTSCVITSAGGDACADTSCVITSAGGDACADTSCVITSAGGDACADTSCVITSAGGDACAGADSVVVSNVQLEPPDSECHVTPPTDLQTLTSSNEQETLTGLNSHPSSKGVFLKPLSFPEVPARDLSHFFDPIKDVPIACLIPTCSETFGVNICRGTGTKGVKCKNDSSQSRELDVTSDDGEETVKLPTLKLQFSSKDEWLRHMFLVHKMVIDKVNDICSLKSYSLYWRTRLSQSPLTDFVAVIRTNSANDASYDSPRDYYLLSSVLPEEKELRETLQKKKLEAVLSVQKEERDDISFFRSCLFCNHVFRGNRSVLFQHMLDVHSFNVGQPDNLVFVKEFLDLLKQKLDKDHMRKKQHKKISPQNHEYDRFYIINYLELGKTWEEVHAEDDREILQEVEDSDWSDWKEHEEDAIFCLFCTTSARCFPSLRDHMTTSHGFDYQDLCRRLRLDYYGQIKLINYIRRKFYVHTCCFCDMQCHSHQELTQHMRNHGHYSIPQDRSIWDQPQYYFPTFENDALLSAIDDVSS